MKELVIISGKGGTGKTSLVASFASLASFPGTPVIADCDVDAADLHIILAPRILDREQFSGGSTARIKPGHCTACGKCAELCRFDAVFYDGPGNGAVPKTFRVDPVACEGCGVCAWFCAEKAIEFKPSVDGTLFTSTTRLGPLVHARLNPGGENSGKLVTRVRTTAREIAGRNGSPLIIADGSPGIGCPVVASITGADFVLAVAEPTVSGIHDLERILDLTSHFAIPSAVAVNKHDVNPAVTDEIETLARRRGAPVAGRIRYDRAVTDAMVKRLTVPEFTSRGVAEDIGTVWANVTDSLAAIRGAV